jgi:hypothetical protein
MTRATASQERELPLTPQAGLADPSRPRFLHRLATVAPLVVLSCMIALPGVVWLKLDLSLWPWDQADYGWRTIDLFQAAIASPYGWLRLFFGAGPKAPGILWFGQLFVPIGLVLGSVDAGLLLSIVVTQLGSALLVYWAIYELTRGRRLIAFASVAPLAAAPLFIGLTHQYLVEPMQLFSTALAVLVLARVPRASAAESIIGLVLFGCIGLLAKVSAPLYLVAPTITLVGALISKHGLRGSVVRGWANWRLAGVLTLSLLVATAVWYAHSARVLLSFAIGGVGAIQIPDYNGPVEVVAPPASGLAYWLQTTAESMLVPQARPAAIAFLVIGLGMVIFAWLRPGNRASEPSARTWLGVCAASAAAGIIIAVGVMSWQSNEQARFLLPLLPYISVLLAWLMVAARNVWLPWLTIALSALQWVICSAYVLGVSIGDPLTPEGPWLMPPVSDVEHRGIVDAAVSYTCTGQDVSGGEVVHNLVGVEGDWFNNQTLTYTSAKRQLRGQPRCQYESLGLAPVYGVQQAWQRVVEVNPEYYLVIPHDQVPDSVGNRGAVAVAELVRTSAAFQQEAIPGHPDVSVFQRVMPSVTVQVDAASSRS